MKKQDNRAVQVSINHDRGFDITPPPLQSQKIAKSVWWFLGVLALFLLVLNSIFPTQSDDLGAGIRGLEGAIASYNGWNGRFFECLRVAYVGAIAPTALFVILNTLIGFGFVLSFFVFIFGRLPRTYNDCLLLAIFMFMMMSVAAFGSFFLWAAGSLNYLWAYFTLLLGFIPYRIFWGRIFEAKSSQHRIDSKQSNAALEIVKALLFMLLCFVGGMSSEMVGIVALLIHLGFLVYGVLLASRGEVKLPLWYYSGIVGLGIGWFALYLSPGHAKRAELFHSWGSYYHLHEILAMSFGELLRHLGKTYGAFKGASFSLIVVPMLLVIFERWRAGLKGAYAILLVVVIILSLPLIKNAHKVIDADFFNLAYFVCFVGFFVWGVWFYKKRGQDSMHRLFIKLLIAALLFCLLVGTTIQVGIPSRARVAYVMIGIVMMWLVWQQFSTMIAPKARKNFEKVIFGLCIGYGIFVLSAYIDGRLKWNAMLDSIAEQKAQGIEEVKVKASTFKSFYRQYGDWGNPGDNPNEWPNTTYAHYFGVKAFVIE